MIRKLLVLLCLLLPSAAQAEWYEATSNNFIVYSEDSERDAREFAAKLERYHYVLRTFHRINVPRAPNRLRVFLFSSAREVGDMYGSASVAGYYMSDARGLMFVGTRSQASGSSGDLRSERGSGIVRSDPESTLLHEYAHHFMFQYFPATYPTWYAEGFAEFWGATRFLPGDVVEVGLPADDRFATFRYLGWLPLQRLLTAHSYAEVRGTNLFLLYAEGWLLNRYVFTNPARKRQLDNYLRLINGGRTYEQAMREAFPDVERFDRELFEYSGRGRFEVVRLPFRTIDVGPINVRPLRAAENALIEREIKLSQSYPHTEAAEFAREVRSIASRYPDDPFALSVLMEAERLAGNNDAAIAAADRLLGIEPSHARAMVTKALANIAALRAASSTDNDAWNAARELLARAMRASPNDPVVLAAYYDGFALQGVLPPDAAQNALYTAMELAPSDDEIRYRLARDFEQRNLIREAIAIIRPVALAQPHDDDESRGERRQRERLEERYRRAGQERHERPREMLARLEQRLAQGGTPAAQPQQPAQRPQL
jgi:tetratricopeptide (TPR) repeat protein